MQYLVSMLVIGGLVWWFSVGPGRQSGDRLSPLTRKLFGALAGGAGVLLALKGRVDLGIVLMSLSAWLLGFRLPAMLDPIGQARRSEIRTLVLRVWLDAGNGDLTAEILGGRFAGRDYAMLDAESLLALARELAVLDPQGLIMIAQDLDRRVPGWRQHVQMDPAAGGGAPSEWGEMRLQEAYQILGLEAGASEEAIRAAHRMLIARFHPDRGGSTYLAALVNRAKDVALEACRHG